MAIRLRTQMAVSHGFIAVITVFLVVLASYILFNTRFLDYLSENQYQEQSKIIENINTAYQNGIWQEENLSRFGLDALKKGYFLTIWNESGQIIWDPRNLNDEQYKEAVERIQSDIKKHFGKLPGMLLKSYKLDKDKTPIGEIRFDYYTTYFLTEHDFMFIKYLNTSLLWVAGISFFISLTLSALISNKISYQLGSILRKAKGIAKIQSRNRKEPINSHVIEIKDLGEAIDDLEERLREKEASNKRLTSDIAHELRTPLTTLQSHLEALMEGVWEPTQTRLESCHEEIVRMASLVNDLEQLNRYELSQIKLIHTKFNISELVRNIYTNFQRDFEIKDIEFKFSGENCIVAADREKLGQVIVNLISNSLKYTPPGGRVFVNTNYNDQFVHIIVNDNGIGMSRQDLPNVFERLYRADESRTRATGGSGIGLAIAKAIVEAHKGKITVVSQEGKGTEFTITLPKYFFEGAENESA
jgi:two-component system, OmpR family, sensor histidine kinase BaeS